MNFFRKDPQSSRVADSHFTSSEMRALGNEQG